VPDFREPAPAYLGTFAPAPRRLGAQALAAVLLVAGCAQQEKAPSSAVEAHPGTPVVLISVDTLRSDRLPAYGYAGVVTPAIDALRHDSILFRHAFTAAPLTLPAHVTALTGLRPDQHGVRDNAGYRLADTVPYLPALLQSAGYRTGGAISAYVLRGTAGLSRGFDHYDDRITVSPRALLPNLQRDGNETAALAAEWLRSVAGEPLFLFFHIYEPHMPHDPPEPFASAYPSPYDGEVAAADAIVGKLLGSLRELGLYDRALILFLSDHGEGLYDHDDYEHGLLLYREILQVPLIVKLPGAARAGTAVERAVSLVDVVPTVLEYLGVPAPESLAGTSLLAPNGGAETALFSETLFPRLHFGWHELFSVVDYPYHLISGPDPELYDLASDPGERENLITRERQVARRLAAELGNYGTEFAPPGEVDAETRRGLAALGYVGNVADSDGPLLDPKSQLYVVERLKGAFEHYAVGEYAEAAADFRKVVTDHPRLVDAWEQLGHSLNAIGRYEEALEAFQTALKLSHGAPHIAGAVAAVLLRLGRLDEARAHAELAVEGHEQSRDVLAQIAIRSGDLEAAEGLVQKAVAGRGTRIDPLLTEAELRLLQNRPQEVVRLSEQAEKEAQELGVEPPPGLFYLRGSAQARMGSLEQAAESFRAEIDRHPDDLDAQTRLALLFYLMKRPADGRETLRKLCRDQPTPRSYAESVKVLRQVRDRETAERVLAEALTRWPDDPALRGLAG
jgi:arylsulfatase A-like enzyme/Tfp pilus assembly protein PilF